MKLNRFLFLPLLLLLILPMTVFAADPEITFSATELVYTGVQDKTTIPNQTIVISNTGTADLTITGLNVTGTDAPDFSLVTPPELPRTITAGNNIAITVRFAPRLGEIGVQLASLSIASDDADEASVNLGLYGLSANGLEGGKEPALHRVVTTLGYAINVGGTGLILGTNPAPIGDEVLMPLMQKAGAGDVTIKAVARYSPHMQLPFGYYFPSGSTPIRNQVAAMSETIGYGQQYPPNHQTLNPWIDAGGATTFDPGNASFGIYVFGLQGRYTYTEDALNATGPTLHAARIYPLKNRQAVAIPNTYLVTFEDASNGDYQDYVYVISNVMPAGAVTPPTSTPTPSPTVTPPPPSGTELITNGGLETDANGDSLPDGWTFEVLTNDTRICNAATAYAGNCAWNFKGSTSENAVISQSITAPATMDTGDQVNLSLYTKAGTGVKGRIKVVIIYTNTTLSNDQIDLALTSSTAYKQVTGSVTLKGKVKRVRFLIRHRSTNPAVELWVDNISVTWQDNNTLASSNNSSALIPLPAVP